MKDLDLNVASISDPIRNPTLPDTFYEITVCDGQGNQMNVQFTEHEIQRVNNDVKFREDMANNIKEMWAEKFSTPPPPENDSDDFMLRGAL